MWRAVAESRCGKQILASSSPIRRATQTCRVDVPSRRAEQIAPMGLRRASCGVLVAACWSRRAGRGRIAETGERVAEVGVRDYGVAVSPRVESAHGEHICCRAVSLLLLVLLGVLYKYSMVLLSRHLSARLQSGAERPERAGRERLGLPLGGCMSTIGKCLYQKTA